MQTERVGQLGGGAGANMVTKLVMALFLGACACIPVYAVAADAARVVATGETAPDFTLEDQNGRKLTLSAERGRQPVVLIFFRGHW